MRLFLSRLKYRLILVYNSHYYDGWSVLDMNTTYAWDTLRRSL